MKEVAFNEILGKDGIFIDGDWVESKDQDINGDVRLVQLADIGDGYFIDKSNRFLTQQKAKELKCTFLKEGDILIARMPDPLGRACIFPKLNIPCVTVVDVCIIRPDKDLVFAQWLKFLINSYEFRNRINKYITGTTRQRISRGNFSKLTFKLPSRSTQIHIANILTKAKNQITQRKESIRLLDEYLKSTFLEMFGDPALNIKKWEKKTLKKISIRFSDGPFGSNLKTEHYSEKGIQVIRLQNIGINHFIEDDISFVKELHYENVLKKYTCYPDDIVIATMGSPNVRASIVPKHLKVSINKADCVLCRVNTDLANPYYVSFLLNQNGFLHLASSFMHGQTRTRISSGQLANILIPIPPIELQTQFAQIVEKTEALKGQCQNSLQELENLYGSLSQRAFRGELEINNEENLRIAAEPISQYRIKASSTIPSNKRGFAKQVLGGKIVSLYKDDKNFTRIKFQKIQYLAEHIIEEDLQWNYYRQTAGPYDNKFMHSVALKLKHNKWFEERNYKYYPLEKSGDIEYYFHNYFGTKSEKLNNLFHLFKNSTEKFSEAVATIYAVWNNHIILCQEFNKENIKRDFFEWSDRKEDLFTEDEYEKALLWMQKHNIIPTGFGELIKERK
ncbi:MAG: restriction endonuclease subunit S [Bacteroidales bacterium]|nr:MAG: restriction endonuclease subunit S [Bacteroidales bacterium]